MDGATANSDNSKRDRALCYHWKANDSDWVKSLDLPAPRNRKHDQARASVLLEALIADRVAPEQFVSYSRRKEWWGTGTRYRDTAYTYATVIPAIDDLTRWGLLEHDRKPPGNLGWQSRFRATPILLRSVAIPPVIYDPVELVRLKDHDGKLTDYRETNNTISMRRRLNEVNEALSAAELQLNHPTVESDGLLLRVGNHLLYPAMGTLYRVFNRGSFARGGRLYGAWWQQIPKDIRGNLLIDGEATVEHDGRGGRRRRGWPVLGPPPSVLLLASLWGRAPDLFGGRALPHAAFACWSSGVAPPAVRCYLHDEIAARGLRQSDVARRLGISRPQLVNILRGRFGASPRITLGLKDFADCPDFEFDNPLPAPVPRTQ